MFRTQGSLVNFTHHQVLLFFCNVQYCRPGQWCTVGDVRMLKLRSLVLLAGAEADSG